MPMRYADDLLGDPLGALVEDEHPVHVALVVDAVLDLLAEVVRHALGRTPAQQVLVEVDADDLVGREEAVLDALLERVGVDRIAEVGEGRDVLRLLRRRGQAELDGGLEVVEDLPPRAVLAGAAAVALVDDHQVEEVRAELLVDVLLFLGAADRLVEREVDLVGSGPCCGCVTLVITEPNGLKSLVMVWSARMFRSTRKSTRLTLFAFHSRQMIWNDRVGLAGAGRHGEEHPALTLGDGLDRPLDGDALVVAGLLAAGSS